MSYKWNWGIFFQLSPDGTYTYLQLLLFGAGWTLATALLAWAIALENRLAFAGAVVLSTLLLALLTILYTHWYWVS